MMRSMFAGVSGLRSHQIRMDVIGNNIANVNTAGYKASRATFQEMLSQTLRGATAPTDNRGGTNAQQIGLGVNIGTIDVRHSQGNTQSTGNITDLAIEGDGFFVLSDGAQTFYTRAGMFGLDSKIRLGNEGESLEGEEIDETGNFVSLVNGMHLMGYKANRFGEIDTNSEIQPLYISSSETINPVATSGITYTGNLDNRYVDEVVSRSATVYDSLGRTHTVMVDLKRNLQADGTPDNSWNWDARRSLLPSEQTTTEAMDSSQVPFEHNGRYSVRQDRTVESVTYDFAIIRDGITLAVKQALDSDWQTVELDADGNEVLAGSTFVLEDGDGNAIDLAGESEYVAIASEDGSTITLTRAAQYLSSGDILFKADGSYQGTTNQSITFQPPLAERVDINFDFSNFTHYEDEFTGKFASQNGFPSGTLESYSIDQNGVVIGSFSNGLTKNLGRVALARFANPAGLQRIGSTMFSESSNSGPAQIAAAGSAGYGNVAPSSLEMSNVDLSQEFTDMIVTQRGFQANSRIITSSDEMLQELVNLKR